MLKRCCSVLLLTSNVPLIERYEALGADLSIRVRAEKIWHESLRVNEGAIICEPEYVDQINKEYIDKVVVILNDTTPALYLKKGVEHFLFDTENDFEIICSMFTAKELVTKEEKPAQILENCNSKVFEASRYKFNFQYKRFYLDGRPIYIKEYEQKYLIEWLLMGHKNNDKRMMLCNMRKRFGKDFLREINRFGKLKEEKNE